MKKLAICITLIAAILTGCNGDEKAAQARLDKARAMYENNEFFGAKNEIDSIRALYPKEVKVLKQGLTLKKLSPVLAMYKAKNFDEALAKAEQLVADGGYGHTSSLYINVNEKEKMAKHAAAMKTCRILVNTPSSQGGIGDLYNFKLVPSLTLGCGSWGGNSVSENVGVKHLINIKTVAERRENMLWMRTPEKVYFKNGCMPVALDELGTVMGKKALLYRNRLFPLQKRIYKGD